MGLKDFENSRRNKASDQLGLERREDLTNEKIAYYFGKIAFWVILIGLFIVSG